MHQAFTQPVVHEEDQFGNLETNDSSTVIKASLASGTGPLQGTTSVRLVGGIATFTDLSDNTPETITLGFSANGLTTGSTSPILVSPGPAAQLAIKSQPTQTATAGQAILNGPEIAEEDAYGNVVTSDSSTVLTAALASGPGRWGER